MPLYEYLCEENGEVVEAVHGMSVRYETWGELCEQTQRDLGDTPADSPVRRLVGAGSVNNKANTVSKNLKRHGEASKSLNHGPTAAPMRSSKF